MSSKTESSVLKRSQRDWHRLAAASSITASSSACSHLPFQSLSASATRRSSKVTPASAQLACVTQQRATSGCACRASCRASPAGSCVEPGSSSSRGEKVLAGVVDGHPEFDEAGIEREADGVIRLNQMISGLANQLDVQQ